jgi:hypothetical protein
MAESKETIPAPVFKIETMDDIRRILTIAQGGNPDAIQAVTDFMNLRSHIERSYFPDKITTLCIGQLEGFGEIFFPTDAWDPFRLISKCLAIAYMPYKGFKSNQFVEITSGQPNLDKLQGLPEETKKGILSGIFGRGKTE